MRGRAGLFCGLLSFFLESFSPARGPSIPSHRESNIIFHSVFHLRSPTHRVYNRAHCFLRLGIDDVHRSTSESLCFQREVV